MHGYSDVYVMNIIKDCACIMVYCVLYYTYGYTNTHTNSMYALHIHSHMANRGHRRYTITLIGDMKMFTVGDYVAIYQQPITKEKFEGMATIVNTTSTEHYYEVLFDGDGPNDTIYRFICE